MARKTLDMQLNSNALTVLARRYLKKDEQGRLIETPEEMFNRVAKNIAQAACFVLPVEDSLESIFDGVKNTALIHQSRKETPYA